jgi:hypothetical protein
LVPARWVPVTSAQPRLVVSCVARNRAEWHTLACNLALTYMTARSTYSAHPHTTAERRAAVRPRECAAGSRWDLALEG